MNFLAKIFVYKNCLYLANCGKYIKNKNIPFGDGPKGEFSIGVTVIGKDNVAISEEAIQMFKKIVDKAKHTYDDISCLAIYGYKKDDVVLSWLGGNKIKIDPNNLEGIFIGLGEGYPELNLLNKLQIRSNDFLRKYKFEKENIETK